MVSSALIENATPTLKTLRRLSSPRKDISAPGAMVVSRDRHIRCGGEMLSIYIWLDLKNQFFY